MKEFWKDYGELCKETGRFYKKHWKGCIVLNAVILGAELAYYQYRYSLFEIRGIYRYYYEKSSQH